MQAATGSGLGGLIGTPTTSHHFNVSIGLAGGQNGEGFYETANNRRLESQIKFTF